MKLLTWNVQWCRGVDGVVSPARIAAEARRLADFDVACFQEVAVNFPELAGNAGQDQPAVLNGEFPGYANAFAWGVEIEGGKKFGNLMLSRPPMKRILRHLEYYSKEHRALQIDQLGEVHREALADRLEVKEPGTFHAPRRPASAIICGDFNLPPHDSLHQRMLGHGFVDAWQALNPGKPHPPSFRLYEHDSGHAPYCCDYVFVTPDLVPRLRSIAIDAATQASDHQPVIVDLG
jgi:endonuclease/exonuclease/phosphatase family metal-dependent hydrolase